MSSTISTIAHAIWAWLPEITVGMRFATALIGFGLTATLKTRRLHRLMRHRRSDHFHELKKPGPHKPASLGPQDDSASLDKTESTRACPVDLWAGCDRSSRCTIHDLTEEEWVQLETLLPDQAPG